MSMEKIEHVVVLMLENRSFDSLLGWLYEHDAPALNIPPAAPGDRFRGLQGVDLNKFINTALNGALSAKPTRGVAGFTVPDYDPGEEFDHVNTQFYGTPTPGPNDPITMTGVLADFAQVLPKLDPKADVRQLAPMSMQSFTPGQLPVLNQLAKHYAVSDAWFASVPSQTNPNRAFLMCGTSNGMVNNGDLEDHNANPQAAGLEKVLGMMIGDDRVDAPTIFNALNDAGIDWTVFWQTSYLPQKISTLLDALPYLAGLGLALPAGGTIGGLALGLLALLSPYTGYLKELSSGDLTSCYTWRLFPQIQNKIPNAAQHFQKLEDFHRRARSGQLPKFSYIEPFWSISHNSNPDLAKLVTALGNDYHPPCNILVGEEFVKEVYTSLIANRDAWCKTLLIITFDEFVGAFDHVTDPLKPGVVTPPWGSNGQPPYKSPTNFKFDRLGARIPTILVSPYVQKSTVFRSATSVPYDHTSVIATTLNWIGQNSRISGFGKRTAAAPTFEGVLTLNQPRSDEMDLSFLDTPRQIGDPVHYGDSFVLKNQNGQYLSTFYRTMKAVGGGSVMPDSVMGICVDLGIAAYFPTLGGDQKAVLSFLTQAPDPAAQINHNSQVMLVSREPGLSALNILGAWDDSHDCYYYDEYLDGNDATKEKWIVQKLDNTNQPLRYGDRLYLVSSFYEGKRLTRDTRWFQGGWITTGSDGDYWTVEPAEARVHKEAIIESVSPQNQVAAGFGQLLYIRGRNLPGVVVFTQSGREYAPQWTAMTSPDLAIVRLPSSLVPGAATVRLTDTGHTVRTQDFPIMVSATPGRPVITEVKMLVGEKVLPGQDIAITAEGMDTEGAVIEWIHRDMPTLTSRVNNTTWIPGSGKFTVITTVPQVTSNDTWTLSLKVCVGEKCSEASLYPLRT